MDDNKRANVLFCDILVMGLYLKSHNKKTDDEVLDHFGADGEDDSDDDKILIEKDRKNPSVQQGHPERFTVAEPKLGTSPLGGVLGILGGGAAKSSVSYLRYKIS